MFKIVRFSNQLLRLGNVLPKKIPCLKTFCTEISNSGGVNTAAIANGDKELEHKLKVIILETDVMKQEGNPVPDIEFLQENHWKELLTLSFSQRRKYLEFLFKLEKTKENRKKKKEERRQQRLETKPIKKENETLEEFVSQYDLQHNSMFLRIYDSKINNFYNNRLIQAMQFGQKFIVDCGYVDNMTKRENKSCAKQLCLMFAENRSHKDPYDLHFCNINRENILMQTLHKFIATLYEPTFPLQLHETSYLDLFPKEKLVYLTPHCREEITEYDHDAIYIIGGIVDASNTEPLSLAKAKREGLRMAKLPLDRHLQWGAGSGKSLTLNQVTSIFLDIKSTGDWKHALRHVPQRKLVHFTEEQHKAERKIWTPKKAYYNNHRTSNRLDYNNHRTPNKVDYNNHRAQNKVDYNNHRTQNKVDYNKLSYNNSYNNKNGKKGKLIGDRMIKSIMKD